MGGVNETNVKRSELVAVARAMLDGKMNLIEGVRKITALRHDVGNPDDEIFMPLRGIESETQHFLLGSVRALAAPGYLSQLDEEMKLYLEDATNDIMAACREIVRVYSQSSS